MSERKVRGRGPRPPRGECRERAAGRTVRAAQGAGAPRRPWAGRRSPV